MSDSNEENIYTSKESTSNFVDLMPLVPVVAEISENLALKLKSILSN